MFFMNTSNFDLSTYFEKELLLRLYREKISKKKTKGIDRVSQQAFAEKKEEEINLILTKIANGSYKFSPFLEELRIKSRDRLPRMISISTIRDRLVLAGLKNALHEYFPESVRKQVASIYINEVSKVLSQNSFSYFVKIDIKNFFDSLSHIKLFDILNSGLPETLYVLAKKAILNPTVPKDCLSSEVENYTPKSGVPQGIAISNILAEIYLREFDLLYAFRGNIKYFRYVDDILILCNDLAIQGEIVDKLDLFFLKPNEDKCSYGSISDGFNYLGFYINNEFISIQEKRVQKFLQKIAGKITWFQKAIDNQSIRPNWLANENTFVTSFIDDLNEKITGAISGSRGYGWLFHYKEMNNINQLYKIENVISTFFLRLAFFENKKPKELKSIIRAYYEVKYRGLRSNYISNYNNIDNVNKKRLWLIGRGIISENDDHMDDYINDIFDANRDRNLKSLEKDEKELIGNY